MPKHTAAYITRETDLNAVNEHSSFNCVRLKKTPLSFQERFAQLEKTKLAKWFCIIKSVGVYLC